jgi:cytochrome c553
MKYKILTVATLFAIGLTAQAEERLDSYKEIRPVWKTCAACHGPQGQGGIGPKLAGQSTDDIISKLLKYKAGETVGPQSMLMWGTAKGLTDGQIGTISVYITQGFPNE